MLSSRSSGAYGGGSDGVISGEPGSVSGAGSGGGEGTSGEPGTPGSVGAPGGTTESRMPGAESMLCLPMRPANGIPAVPPRGVTPRDLRVTIPRAPVNPVVRPTRGA